MALRYGKQLLSMQQIREMAAPTKKKTGFWLPARLSGRAVARLRRQAFESGKLQDFPFQGERTPFPQPKAKGHKWEKAKEERLAKIEKNLKKADEDIQEFRLDRRENRLVGRLKKREMPIFPRF